MSRVYLSLLTSILAFSLKAQYTITSASNPAIGDVEDYKSLFTPVSLGTSGIGQTWNYSSVTISTVTAYSSTYVPMSSVPNNTFFTGGTIGADYGSGNYDVYSNNSTQIEKTGSYISPNSFQYTDPETVLVLPFSYGNTFTDTYAFGPMTATCNVTCDGTGTLKLPGGLTYFNVLKNRYSTNQMVLGIGPTPPTTYTITEDRYYSSVSKFYLLSVSQQTAHVQTTTTYSYSQNGRINVAAITGIKESEKEFHELSIFPNPNLIGDLNIRFYLSTNENCELLVFNSLGQLVRSDAYSDLSPGINQRKIDLQSLENGIYYLKLKTNSKEFVQKVAINR